MIASAIKVNVATAIHRMQIWRTSRPARVKLRKSEASEASRVLF